MRRLIALIAVALLAGCAEDSPVIDPETNDADNDGFTDAIEILAGTDPNNATRYPVPARVFEEISFSEWGTIIGGLEDPTGEGCGAVVESGTFRKVWGIAAPANTTGVYVTDLIFTGVYSPTMPEGDVYVFSPSGELLTTTTPVSTAVPPTWRDTVTVEGKHPPGDYTLEIRGCAGAGDVAIEASGTLSYIPNKFDVMAAQPAQA